MPRLLGQGPSLVLPSILGHWLDAFTECWLDSREEPPPHPSHPFLPPLEWPPSLSSPGRNTDMPLSSAKCFSFHSTVLTLPVSPDPTPRFLPLSFLRPLPPSSGPWLSHISPLHSRSSLCSSFFSSSSFSFSPSSFSSSSPSSSYTPPLLLLWLELLETSRSR